MDEFLEEVSAVESHTVVACSDLEDILRGQCFPLLFRMSQTADQKDGFLGHLGSITLENGLQCTEKDRIYVWWMAASNMPGKLLLMERRCHATTSPGLPLLHIKILSRRSAFERGI